MPDIEFTAMSQSLPVNSKAMLNRLNELLEENKTNCLEDICNSWNVRAVMWMLMSQVFGQGALINVSDLWLQLYGEYNSKEV